MKRINVHILIFLIVLTNVFVTNAQEKVSGNEYDALKTLPQEHIYAHLNTTLFLTGEYAYYKVYCIDARSKKLSGISKVVYVELISSNGEKVVEQKLILSDGQAFGDFFLPTTLNTGQYKLIAYTNWMRNFEESQFFESDIHIINPYKPIPENILRANIEQSGNKKIREYNSTISNNAESVSGETLIGLKTNRETYQRREKVSLSLEPGSENLEAQLSLSVRKIDNLPKPEPPSLKALLKKDTKKGFQGKDLFLPEMRGEIICGQISSQTGNLVSNLKVALSIPGSSFHLGITTTSVDGTFYFSVNNRYPSNTLAFQVLDNANDDYKIELCKETPLNNNFTELNPLVLNETMSEEILTRSLHNQLDNAYFGYRLDTTTPNKTMQLFSNWKASKYGLDDYTRFKTIEETLFEYVKNVFVRRIDGKKTIQIQGYDFDASSGVPPLIILDGFLIQNHHTLLEQNAINFDEIIVYRNQFVIGPKAYQGALILSTNKETEYFLRSELFENVNLLTTQNFLGLKKYANQAYTEDSSERYSRIPDDRYQLLWKPDVQFSEDQSSIEFYTSDVTGNFEICVEGLTKEGVPILVKKIFEVKK